MRILIAVLLFLCTVARAANPAFGDFDLTQFRTNGNKVSINSGSTITNASLVGYATMSGQTNRLTISNNQLLLDGTSVSAGDVTNTYNTIITTNLTVLNNLYTSNFFATNVTVQNNLTVSNFYTVNGKNNTLIVTNALTPQQIGANKLAGTDSSGILTNVALTGDVTTSGLAATIANDAVTYAKMQNVSATARAIGRNTAGSGDPEEVTGTQILDWIGSTQGNVLYRGASSWAVLAPGTSGYLLQSGGAAANPSWVVAPSGGLATSGSAYSIIGGSAIATNNWVALSNAYVTAKAATPHGLALGASNRYSIFLLPGTYDMTAATLTLDTLYIDIIGVNENTGSLTYQIAPAQGNTIVKSSTTPIILNSTSDSSSHDIGLVNLCLVSSSNDSTNSTLSVNQAGFGSKFYCQNVNFVLTGSGARVHQFDKNFNGTWIDCRAFHNRAFGISSGSAVTVNGTFIRCKTDRNGFLGEYNAFGNFLSGTFIDCEGGDGSFGGQYDNGDITVSGTFIRCRHVFTQGTTMGLFGGQGGTCTGTFIDCDGNANAFNFGAGGFGGTMIRCSSGLNAWTAATTGTVRNSNIPGWGEGPYAMNTADSTTITNTAADTAFSITRTIQRGDWKIGRAFRWEVRGKYSATNSLPGTITFKTKFNTTAANTSDALPLPATGGTNLAWKADGLFVCRTTGASGTVSSQSHYEMEQGTLGVLNESLKPSNGTTTVAMNADVTFQLSVMFSVAANSNGINVENFLLEPLGMGGN